MPSSVVNELIKAVRSLHDDVLKCNKDMEWVKRGLLGIYGIFGAAALAVIGAWVTR